MAHFRAHEIVEIIELGTYPYQFPSFSREQLATQRLYPSTEVVNVQPESTDERIDVTDERNRFEIRVYIKLSRNDDAELKDLYDIEREIIAQLESATLADKQIVLEQKTWSRGDIRKNPLNVHGEQSTLTVTVLEKKSTSGLGNIGGSSTITIGSLTDIPFLDKPVERETEINENIYNTARQRKALSSITDIHSFLGEIEYTKARIDELRALKRARSVVTGITYKRPGVADETFTGKIVEISNGAPFDNIETIVFQIERLT